MLLRRISSLKYAFSNTGRFEWEKGLYDPSKHIYMSRRGMPMLYDSLWEVGSYPDNHFFNSIAPKTYEPQIIDTFIKILNETYGVKPTAATLQERGFRTWERLFKKDLKIKVDPYVILTKLLNQLAVNIFVKESRFTWPLEQKLRLEYTSLHFDLEEPATFTEFLEFYNNQIQQLVLISSLGYSPNIDQENYALERQLLTNAYEAVNPAPLIQIAANRQTLLNKMLVWSHRL